MGFFIRFIQTPNRSTQSRELFICFFNGFESIGNARIEYRHRQAELRNLLYSRDEVSVRLRRPEALDPQADRSGSRVQAGNSASSSTATDDGR